ncbi:hypothetical protein Pla52n_55020 [Stieleria varia]|uniref:Uncharacterized protein n=1 Tax=Stieleria varia TaxID=2528005 RepID=A0A5C6A5C1_9BACT|nr:hypothetical protein Pla52n_55020 [Stieleria varia]
MSSERLVAFQPAIQVNQDQFSQIREERFVLDWEKGRRLKQSYPIPKPQLPIACRFALDTGVFRRIGLSECLANACQIA